MQQFSEGDNISVLRAEADLGKFYMISFAAAIVMRKPEGMMKTCFSPEIRPGCKIIKDLGKGLLDVRCIVGVKADEKELRLRRIAALPRFFSEQRNKSLRWMECVRH